MRKVNLLYLAVIPICLLLYNIRGVMGNDIVLFYGFADNKDTEMSHDRPVMVHKIMVTPGQEVRAGQLIMEVKQAAVAQRIRETDIDLEQVELRDEERRRELNRRIEQLSTDLRLDQELLAGKIRTLEAEVDYQRSLREGLRTLQPSETGTDSSTVSIKSRELTELRERLSALPEPVELEIRQLRNQLSELNTSAATRRAKLRSQLDYYNEEERGLRILAPGDGVIGNLLCKEGEYVPAFRALVEFYERSPTMAKGFVHESLITEVKLGDLLEVNSSMHPDRRVEGEVIGLGTRIVEIPERLRKIPEFKTYGREVLVSIPSENAFLQKEKLIFNTLQ